MRALPLRDVPSKLKNIYKTSSSVKPYFIISEKSQPGAKVFNSAHCHSPD